MIQQVCSSGNPSQSRLPNIGIIGDLPPLTSSITEDADWLEGQERRWSFQRHVPRFVGREGAGDAASRLSFVHSSHARVLDTVRLFRGPMWPVAVVCFAPAGTLSVQTLESASPVEVLFGFTGLATQESVLKNAKLCLEAAEERSVGSTWIHCAEVVDPGVCGREGWLDSESLMYGSMARNHPQCILCS